MYCCNNVADWSSASNVDALINKIDNLPDYGRKHFPYAECKFEYNLPYTCTKPPMAALKLCRWKGS